jgi:hypothetical protein
MNAKSAVTLLKLSFGRRIVGFLLADFGIVIVLPLAQGSRVDWPQSSLSSLTFMVTKSRRGIFMSPRILDLANASFYVKEIDNVRRRRINITRPIETIEKLRQTRIEFLFQTRD